MKHIYFFFSHMFEALNSKKAFFGCLETKEVAQIVSILIKKGIIFQQVNKKEKLKKNSPFFRHRYKKKKKNLDSF